MEKFNLENGIEITECRNKPMTLELCLIGGEANLSILVNCTEEFKELGWNLIEKKDPELMEKVLESLKNNIELKFELEDKVIKKSLKIENL